MVTVWQKLSDSRLFFILLFLIPATAFLVGLDWTLLNVFFVIATEIILAHAVYAGYAVLRQQEKMNLIQYSLLGSIWLAIFILFYDWESIQWWFLSLVAILLIGMTFNWYTKNVSKQYNIKEFCRAKIYVDLVGLLLGIGGVIFVKISQHYLLLGILNIIIIVLINYIVFFKIRLFGKLKH